MDGLVTVTDSPAVQQLPPPTRMPEGFAPRPQAHIGRRQNLGIAILLTAIQDYRSLDPELHENAAEFLFPRARACKEHYAWVVGLAEGVNSAWIRNALDRARKFWDAERAMRLAQRERRRA